MRCYDTTEVIEMEVRCVLEHNGSDSLLYCADLPGAYARGENPEEAILKMEGEV